MSGAGSLKSHGNEGRGFGEGVGQFFLQGRVKGLAKSLQHGIVEMLLES